MTNTGYCVRLIDLPVSVDALVAYDEYGYASVYLNARLSREMQQNALRHEMRHIGYDDAYNTDDIMSAEYRAGAKSRRHHEQQKKHPCQ